LLKACGNRLRGRYITTYTGLPVEKGTRNCSRNWTIQTSGSSGLCITKMAYRLFAFWDTDTDTLVVATHGIIKKTQKTPQKEIAKAEAIMRKYFEYKKKH